jgi:hypothetical protein
MRKRPWPNYSSLKLGSSAEFFVTVMIVPSNLGVRMHVPQVRVRLLDANLG